MLPVPPVACCAVVHDIMTSSRLNIMIHELEFRGRSCYATIQEIRSFQGEQLHDVLEQIKSASKNE